MYSVWLRLHNGIQAGWGACLDTLMARIYDKGDPGAANNCIDPPFRRYRGRVACRTEVMVMQHVVRASFVVLALGFTASSAFAGGGITAAGSTPPATASAPRNPCPEGTKLVEAAGKDGSFTCTLDVTYVQSKIKCPAGTVPYTQVGNYPCTVGCAPKAN